MTDQPEFPAYRDSEIAPIIYFDVVPALGTMNGAIQIELASRTLAPLPDNQAQVTFMTTGRLRCSPAAATALREAIDKALKMLQQPQEAVTVSTGRLN
jgi:hypothetical protein